MNIAVQNIVPGQYNAILEMADGSTYHLGEQQGSLQEKTGRLIKIDSTLVSYLPVSNKQEIPQEIVYNKLSVPRGGGVPDRIGRWNKSMDEFGILFTVSDCFF